MLDKIRACIIAKFYGTPKPLLQLGKQSENQRDLNKKDNKIVQNVNSQNLKFVNPNYPAEESTEKEARSHNVIATNAAQVTLFHKTI